MNTRLGGIVGSRSVRVSGLLGLVAVPLVAVTDTDVVRVGVYDNPPKIYRDDSGEPAGFWAELTRVIAEREGWELEWVHGAWWEGLARLDDGRIDVMVDVAYTDGRQQRFTFGDETVHVSWSQIYAISGSDIETIPDLEGARIGALEDSVNLEADDGLRALLEEFAVDAETLTYVSYDGVFSALEAGEVDAAVSNREFGNRLSAEYDVIATPILFQPADLRYAFPTDSPGSAELREAFGANIRMLKEDPSSSYHTLRTGWLSVEQGDDSSVPGWLIWTIGALLGLVVLLVIGVVLVELRVRARTRALYEQKEALRRSQEMLERSQRIGHVGSWRYDVETGTVEWSDETYRNTGVTPGEVTPSVEWLYEHVHPDDRRRLAAAQTALLAHGTPYDLTYRIVRPDGDVRHVYERAEREFDRRGRVRYVQGTFQDITALHLAEERLRRLAYHDPLTGLVSRNGFVEGLTGRVGPECWPQQGLVVALDVIGMHDINDAYGYEAGDQLLQRLAERLQEWAGDNGLAARTGGDAFMLYLEPDPEPDPERDSDDVMDALSAEFSRAVDLSGTKLVMGVRMGYTTLDTTPRGVADLIREAELALFHNREQLGRSWSGYSRQIDEADSRRIELTRELRQALEEGQFQLRFQPKVDLTTGRIHGCEALLRWEHPERGQQMPGEFIPIAEKSRLIGPIGDWVIHDACRQVRAWRDSGVDAVRVSVNVSVVQFMSGNLPQVVRDALAAHDVAPCGLTLEVTESVFERESESLLLQLRELHDMGVRLSLDDFGTGYSSLLYLQTYPFDEIKIDRGFVRHIVHDSYSRAIVATVVGLARAFDAEVVAEGIEDTGVRDALLELGCTLGQGFYYSYPVDEAAFRTLLAGRQRLPRPASTSAE